MASWPERRFFISKAGESLAWAPDGSEIAFVAAAAQGAEPSEDPRVIAPLPFKTRTGYVDNTRAQIFAARLSDGRVRQLSHLSYDAHSISWSSKGEIAFLANRTAASDPTFHYDIFVLDPGTGRERQLSHAKGVAYSPAWSPDGASIAYLSTTRPITTIDSVAEDWHVWLIDRSGAARQLSEKLDRRASPPQWSVDGKEVYFSVQNQGENDVYSVPAAGGAPHAVIQGPATVRAFSVGGSTLAFTRTADAPVEIWLADASGDHAKAATSLNTALVQQWKLSAPQMFWYASFDQKKVQAWLIPPLEMQPGRKYPLVLTIHGGPHGMYGYGFEWTNQVWAGKGYGVLYMNPRGSTGYGQSFTDGCVNDWGGADYRDLMAGVDAALAKYPWIDRDRLVVTGQSYGGYMTDWIVTQTNRFRAAVSIAGLSNLISFYGTSLYQDLIHAEFGKPWEPGVYPKLWDRSALAHIAAERTPVLFSVGELDNDVPMQQSEEMYAALRWRGIDSLLVEYPREGHGLREPEHRVDQLKRSFDWFDRHLQDSHSTAHLP